MKKSSKPSKPSNSKPSKPETKAERAHRYYLARKAAGKIGKPVKARRGRPGRPGKLAQLAAEYRRTCEQHVADRLAVGRPQPLTPRASALRSAFDVLDLAANDLGDPALFDEAASAYQRWLASWIF